MGLFGTKNNSITKKASRKIIVWIQAGLVETACQHAEICKTPLHDAGIAALLHSLAVVFQSIDDHTGTDGLSKEQAVELKSTVSDFFIRNGFQDGLKKDQIELFLRPVYDLQRSLFAQGSIHEEKVRRNSAASICELSGIPHEKEEEIAEDLKVLALRLDKLFKSKKF